MENRLQSLDDISIHYAQFLTAFELTSIMSASSPFKILFGNEGTGMVVWESLCRSRWAPRPRYSLDTGVNREWGFIPGKECGSSWRKQFIEAEREGSRSFLRANELVDLKWFFNFRSVGAGGRGLASVQQVQFHPLDENSSQGFLHMRGFPPLKYHLKMHLSCAIEGCQQVATKSCSTCKMVLYCSRECQRRHWLERHRAKCSPEPAVITGEVLPNPKQLLMIANFKPHVVSRIRGTWEWRIHNTNVCFVSAAAHEDVSSEPLLINF